MSDIIKQIDDCITHMKSKGTVSIKGFEASDKDEAIRAALSALQKIANGDDYFPIETCSRHKAFIKQSGDGWTWVGVCERFDGVWGRLHFGGWEELEGTPTHWKPLDGSTHIQMLMEKELNDD